MRTKMPSHMDSRQHQSRPGLFVFAAIIVIAALSYLGYAAYTNGAMDNVNNNLTVGGVD